MNVRNNLQEHYRCILLSMLLHFLSSSRPSLYGWDMLFKLSRMLNKLMQMI